MAGLRDIVAHEYFGISLEIVWGSRQKQFTCGERADRGRSERN
jgi:uncharacterized protein with HEPN domain